MRFISGCLTLIVTGRRFITVSLLLTSLYYIVHGLIDPIEPPEERVLELASPWLPPNYQIERNYRAIGKGVRYPSPQEAVRIYESLPNPPLVRVRPEVTPREVSFHYSFSDEADMMQNFKLASEPPLTYSDVERFVGWEPVSDLVVRCYFTPDLWKVFSKQISRFFDGFTAILLLLAFLQRVWRSRILKRS
jgi:hypothetical protein